MTLYRFGQVATWTFVSIGASSCAFNFELKSQRTSLENQILGSYKEIDEDVILASSVRSLDKDGKAKVVERSDLAEKAIRAKQNQEFNRDDIDELKVDQIVGESFDGAIIVLPDTFGRMKAAKPVQQKLAEVLLEEENRDRAIIWQRMIDQNENLQAKDLAEVRKTYAKVQREASPEGSWIQDDSQTWKQKQK